MQMVEPDDLDVADGVDGLNLDAFGALERRQQVDDGGLPPVGLSGLHGGGRGRAV